MTGQPQESTPSDAPVAAVAVVLRTRNRPQLLPRALASIGAQTFRDFRVIVVNDGGDEGPVLEQVAACPAVRGQVDVVTNPQSVGREAAMNTGVTHSRSEFLVIHDDDDTWHPEFLAATVGHLQDSTDAAVAVRTEVVYEELTPEGVVEIRREILAADKSAITLGEVLRANISPPISVLYRRSVHDEVGLYDGTLPVLADWDFMLRLLSVHTVGFVDGTPLAYWHHRTAAGDLGNSVVVASDDHARYIGIIRDRYLRTALAASGGLGVGLHLAAESVRLDTLAQRRHEHLDWRLGEIEGRLVAGLEEANRQLVTQANRTMARLLELEHRLDALERIQLSQTPRVRLRNYLKAAQDLSARFGRRSAQH